VDGVTVIPVVLFDPMQQADVEAVDPAAGKVPDAGASASRTAPSLSTPRASGRQR
jgi:hypothetical protein